MSILPAPDWLDKLEPYETSLLDALPKTMWKIPPERYCKRYEWTKKPKPPLYRLRLKAARAIDALSLVERDCFGYECDCEPMQYREEFTHERGECIEWSR